jgi:hypothetical protein
MIGMGFVSESVTKPIPIIAAQERHSTDLESWSVVGPVLTERPHEGPNVFEFAGNYWMIVDEWRGQGVFRSTDLQHWERNGVILDRPGRRTDDGTIGLHADVTVNKDRAMIFYFTHLDRNGKDPQPTLALRRSSLQVAELHVSDGVLTCDRDADPATPLPIDGPS